MDFKSDLIIETARFKKEHLQKKQLKTNFGATITKTWLENEKGKMFNSCTLEKFNANYYLNKETEAFSKIFGKLLKEIITKNCSQYPKRFLVVCLGNKDLVCDALAPLTMEKLLITRNYFQAGYEIFDERLANVCAISPDVFGATGVESADIVQGVVKNVKPELVVIIDTLCAENYKRIGKSFQVAFKGLTPGGGVSNERKMLDESTLGVKVISLGVPMVVRASTLLKNNGCGSVKKQLTDLIITTNDIEHLNQYCSKIIARALNMAMHKNVSYKELLDYVT